ncbi:non-ribosomal peptide synthetase [Myxosarcina sp. GI1]|uniref:non-ribosomal peptide synthetase family protein n=1 Tax=Myxosarcina sp. GI1 TaxID=1541065 RepID=UPI00056AC210|nr:non-ribosomal peptide synthetase [Myxosarcina sp. GI1]
MQNLTLEGFWLSPQQKHLWSLQPNSSAYRAQCAVNLEGELDVEILQQAIKQIVNRHEILRTRFVRQPGMIMPMQVIETVSNFSWQTLDLKDLTSQQQQLEIDKLFQTERNYTYDWEKDALLRLSLLILSPQNHTLLITLPSLCCDRTSLKNLVKEISYIYSSPLNPLPPYNPPNFEGMGDLENENDSPQNWGARGATDEEPTQYLQFSEWHNELLTEEDVEEGQAYWQQLDSPKTATLPFEKRSSEINFQSDVYSVQFDPTIVNKLECVASLHNTTIEKLLLTYWQIFLWRLTGQSEITVETIFDGRSYEELEETLGLLAKWLPVCCSFKNEAKFSEILDQTSQNLENHHQWQEYYLWQENTDSNNRIAFEYVDLSDKYSADGVSFISDRQYVCFEPFKLKLTCIRKAESLIAEFHYDRDLIDLEDIKYWGNLFQNLVASAVNNPEAKVSELEILNTSDRHKLLVEYNQNQADHPLDKCIHQLFEEQVVKTPNNIAVVFEDEQLTYAELNHRANQLAHYLQRLEVKSEVLVGICLERSLENIISLLAIIKAGGAYLPLDPALPPAAVALRLQDAQAKVLLTQQKLSQNLRELDSKIVCLDSNKEIIARESKENPDSEVKPENLIYVIYTSGSTGKPKGVAIEHRQLLNYFYAIQPRLNIPAGSNYALVSTFSADLGNTVIFPSLCTGGCLHIIPSETASDPQALSAYCDRHSIDCLKIVPSHLNALLTAEQPAKILPRQRLILGGEVASWDLIDRLRELAPECKILNHYGPTEATIGVTTFEVDIKAKNKSATVPIGKAIANTQIYLLDSQGQPVPIGVPGELHIGGTGLARGYLNQPQLTAEKFIPNPHVVGAIRESSLLYKTGDRARYLPDGNIEFLGRTDNQVKIRGFRVELGEIEAVLSQHPDIEQAVVTVSEDRRLVAHVVPKQLKTLNSKNLRNFALNKLPEYATPSTFVFLKTLPLTPNGKIDRQALPASDSILPELEAVYTPPRTPIEAELAEIWQELLNLERVGINDNFFELGGHSLLITQLLARIRDTFKIEISLQSLFKLPTVANIAQKIAGKQDNAANSIDLQAEAVLDPTIHPNGLVYSRDIKPTAIFLTGATGFLGAFLLYELLQQTQADIYCLVRSPDLESGKQKLQNNLASYLLWKAGFNNRIIPVIGDLSQPLLGLSQSKFQQLATQIDDIYHNGALVNFTYPYQTLKKPNVLGTQEVLRLASQVKLKPVHFISTTSFVYPAKEGIGEDSNLRIIREEDSIDNALMPTDGYAQSKWVAEKLVTIARDRGMPIFIYRPGRISGHSKTGACNSNDHTYRIIKGCIQLGSIPDLNIEWNLSPCDYVSKAIVYLSQQSESLGKAFYLRNPQPFNLKAMAQYLDFLGYPVKLVDYEQWRSRLNNNSTNNALYPLISTFTNPEKSPVPKQKYDCSNAIALLADSDINCPQINRELFGIYISYLVKTGVLNPVNT